MPRRARLPNVTCLTAGQFVDRWLAGIKGSLRATSYARYESLIRLHIKPVIGGVKLSKLTPFHVEQFFAELEQPQVGSTTRKMCSMVLGKAASGIARRGN